MPARLHSKALFIGLRVTGLIGHNEGLKSSRNMVADHADAKALINRAKHSVPVTQVLGMLTAPRAPVQELPETHIHFVKAAEKSAGTLRAILEMQFGQFVQTVCRL